MASYIYNLLRDLKILITSKNAKISADDVIREEENASIEKLPDETLLNIFSYLTVYDLHNKVALVSKRWQSISRDKILEPKILYLDINRCPKDALVLRRYKHIALKLVCFLSDCKLEPDLIQECARLRELHIADVCGISEPKMMFESLVEILSSLPQTVNILRLNFKDNLDDFLSNRALTHLSSCNLERLSLRMNYYWSPDVLDYPIGLKCFSVAYYRSAPINYVAEVIAANRTTLEELKVGRIDAQLLFEIMRCDNLKKITLESDPQFANWKRFNECLELINSDEIKLRVGVIDFWTTKEFSGVVTSVVINNWFHSSVDSINFPIIYHPSVVKLRLNNCGMVTTLGYALQKLFRNIKRFPNVEILKICQLDFKRVNFPLTVFLDLSRNLGSLRKLVLLSVKPMSDIRKEELRGYNYFCEIKMDKICWNRTVYKVTIDVIPLQSGLLKGIFFE